MRYTVKKRIGKSKEACIVKVAVIGSRTLTVPDLGAYLPPETTEIVSGGAHGVDRDAAAYALATGLRLTEFRPDYAAYGHAAPLLRNLQIIDYSEIRYNKLRKLKKAKK